MKSLFAGLSYCAAIVLVAASAASAQDQLPAHHWSRGTTLAVTGGAATASDDVGGALGATIGWELTPQIGIEGTGMWIDREPGASAFRGSLNVRAALTRTAPLSPFVEGGFGMYVAKFDSNQMTNIPPFYSERMAGLGTSTSPILRSLPAPVSRSSDSHSPCARQSAPCSSWTAAAVIRSRRSRSRLRIISRNTRSHRDDAMSRRLTRPAYL